MHLRFHIISFNLVLMIRTILLWNSSCYATTTTTSSKRLVSLVSTESSRLQQQQQHQQRSSLCSTNHIASLSSSSSSLIAPTLAFQQTIKQSRSSSSTTTTTNNNNNHRILPSSSSSRWLTTTGKTTTNDVSSSYTRIWNNNNNNKYYSSFPTTTSTVLNARNNNNNNYDNYDTSLFYKEYQQDMNMNSGYNRPVVQWYPGHIAKAERQLSETLKVVDVVVEVRDARACKATSHPNVGEWCAGKPRIVALTHVDSIPKIAQRTWKDSYDTFGAEQGDLFTNEGLAAQITNQAMQAKQIRQQYNTNNNSPTTNNQHKKNNNSNNNNKKVQQHKQKQQRNNSNSNSNSITPVEQVLFVNAKQGTGIHALHRAIWNAGSHVQERREKRGLKERPLRVGVIGYPNVGKSALLNKLLGRRRARTANTPGVTRSLQWIRVRDVDVMNQYATSTTTTDNDNNNNQKKKKPNSSNKKKRPTKEFEILDSPGIIPAKMVDQSDALLLAACNCIGQAAYDNQAVAAYLFEWLKATHLMGKGSITSPQWRTKCLQRYGFDPLEQLDKSTIPGTTNQNQNLQNNNNKQNNNNNNIYYRTGEDMLYQVADNTCNGNQEDASRKMLQDFRTGRLGLICLQMAPKNKNDPGQIIPNNDDTTSYRNNDLMVGTKEYQLQQQTIKQQNLQKEENKQRAKVALETIKLRGLELPPSINIELSQQTNEKEEEEKDITTTISSSSSSSATTSSSETYNNDDNNDTTTNKKKNKNQEDEIGKGLFDGW